MNRNKTIAKNSFFLYFRLLFLMFIGLYSSRITLDVLGVEDFGIYNLVGGIITTLSFLYGSMSLSVTRYLTFSIGKDDLNEANMIFSMSLTIHVIISLFVILLGETVGLWFVNTQLVIPNDRMLVANVVYQCSIISFILLILMVPYNAEIIAHEKMNVFAYLSIIQGVMKLVVVLILPYILIDKLFLYAVLLSAVSVLSFLLYYIYVKKKFEESHYVFMWSKPLFSELTKFAGFSTFGPLAVTLVTQAQNILLNIFFGPTLNAVQGLAMQVNNNINGFVQGVYTAVNPPIVKAYARKDKNYFLKLIKYSTILGYAVLFTVMLPLFLEVDFILSIWLKEIPDYASTFIRLVLIVSLINTITTPSMLGFQATGNVKAYQLTTGFIHLMNIAIVWIMWSIFDLEPYSIFYVQIFLCFCVQIAVIYYQRYLIEISVNSYLNKVVLPLLLSSLLAIFVPFVLHYNMESDLKRFLLVCIISIICSVLSFLYVGINREVRILIWGYIKSHLHMPIQHNNVS